MNTITTQLTDKELTDLGRAMEKDGYTEYETYMLDIVMQRVNTVLSEKES